MALRRRLGLCVLGLCLLGLSQWGVSTAWASFVSSPAAPSLSVTTGTLAAPTGLAAVNTNCVILTSTRVRLDWTPSASVFDDGQQVQRATSAGGPYSTIATLSAAATTHTDTGVGFSTTYWYRIRATAHAWSADSTTVSITTPSALCII